MLIRWLPSVGALLILSCRLAERKVDVAAVRTAIEEASATFSRAETSGKADSALTFIWDDATLQPPDTAQIEGRDAIRRFYSRAMLSPPPADSTPSRSARTIQISTSGDLAAEWGPGAIVVQLPSGPLLVRFKFMILWERRNGVWKVRFNSWSNRPT